MTHTIRLTKSGHNPQTKTHTHTCTHLEANRQTDKQIGPPTHTHTDKHARLHAHTPGIKCTAIHRHARQQTDVHCIPFWSICLDIQVQPLLYVQTHIHTHKHTHAYIHTYVYIYMYLQCQNYQLRIRFADETHGLILPEAPGCTGWQKFFGLCLITEKTMRTF